MNSMKSDWKPGLVSNKYRQNYDRIFRQINVIVDENLPRNLIDFYFFEKMSPEEYKWFESRWIT